MSGAPAGQHATRDLLTTMRENGALNGGEYRALLAALRHDLVEAVWAARKLERDETLALRGKRRL